MKKILSILTAALFALGAALPSFAEDLPDLYPAPPLEKPANSAQKHGKAQPKAKKAGKAKKAVKQKTRKARR